MPTSQEIINHVALSYALGKTIGHHMQLQIFDVQSRTFRDARKHPRSNFFAVVESENVVGPPLPCKDTVRTGSSLDSPAYPQQSSQYSGAPRAGPLTHAALNEILSGSGPASPCSRRSASTRSASAWTLATACSEVVPYAMTPESSVTSASQRPSSSCSVSIRKIIVHRPTSTLPTRRGSRYRRCRCKALARG